MLTLSGNLFDGAHGDGQKERISALLEARDVRIERIVSLGQKSPPGVWYEEPWAEWVGLGRIGRAAFRRRGRRQGFVPRRLHSHSGACKTPCRMDQQGSCDDLACRSLSRTRIEPESCNSLRFKEKIMCKVLDLRFQALPDEITACHSSLGGEFGEWIDVVKDASFARAGAAGVVHP
jgi:hypothetical protein